MMDSLTGLYNRRAYEIACSEIDRKKLQGSMVLVSCDINGLKKANDTLGHKVGDELITGAATVLQKAFGKYGKSYRIGGDEFVTILQCDKATAEACLKVLDNLVDNWYGENIETLSIAKSVVYGAEHPDLTLEALKELGDQTMYTDKAAYYNRKLGK